MIKRVPLLPAKRSRAEAEAEMREIMREGWTRAWEFYGQPMTADEARRECREARETFGEPEGYMTNVERGLVVGIELGWHLETQR